jgi:Zn finger protein HypA/HybF involved in hydrogenase expression
MVKLRIPTLTCLRCGHRWVPRQTDVRICPKCKSARWDVPRRTNQGLRSDIKKPGRRRASTRKRP